jgi:hypothetical protein
VGSYLIIYLVVYAYPKKELWTLYLLIPLSTAVFVFMGVSCLQEAVSPFFLSKYGVRAPGTVIQRTIEYDINDIPSVVVQVEFFTPTGPARTWFYYRDFPVGSAVPLLYNPYMPANVRLDEPRSRLGETIHLGPMILGLALLVPSLWLFVWFLVAF